jgi:thioredoxin reductase
MYDAVIIGGGAAGLTAALYLGRFRRNVIVFDTARQANRVSHAAHGFFTRDGASPSELISIGQEQLRQYQTVQIQNYEVTAITPIESAFSVTLSDNSSVMARKVILATGLKDHLPAIQGIEAYWGKSVFHCPYCDGWEARDKPVAIINDGGAALHVAKLLRVLTEDLVLCTNGNSSLTEQERAALNGIGVQIIETPIARIEGHDGHVECIVLEDGQTLACDRIFIRTNPVQHAPFVADLGCEMLESGFVKVDEFGRTSVPGVYAAGDLASRFRQVVMAASQGATAGVGVNMDLISEDFPL